MNCAAASARMEGLFVGELEPAEFARLRDHVKACGECRAQYDRIARVEASLLKRSSHRTDLLLADVLARVQERTPVPSRPLRWRLMPLWGALALVVLAVPVTRLMTRSDEYQPRGQATALFGIRAFCVSGAPEPKVVQEAREGETLRCPTGSALQLTYTAARSVRLSIVAQTPSGELRLFPARGELDVVENGADVPLPHSTPVDESWLTAEARIRARFSDVQTNERVAESTVVLVP